MSGLTVNPSFFPIFASEPRVREGGYRSRYANLGTYAEIPTGQAARPKTYSFQPVAYAHCDTAAKDFTSLLCSGTQSFSYPARYLDRTAGVNETVDVIFEGRVSYTCNGNGYTRGDVVFYSTRKVEEEVTVVI